MAIRKQRRPGRSRNASANPAEVPAAGPAEAPAAFDAPTWEAPAGFDTPGGFDGPGGFDADEPTQQHRDPAALPASADATDRATLIHTCIYLRDRITSIALAQRLDQALAEVGVVTLNPVGEPFDPSWQEAAGVEATNDPASVGTVAMVETPGYADRGMLLRAPVVTVYQATS